MIDAKTLSEWSKVCDAPDLTPAPWEVNHRGDWPRIEHPLEVEEDCEPDWQHVSDLDDCVTEGDRAFIALARTALPEAIERIRELEAALAKAADDMESIVSYVPEYFQDKWDMADDVKAARDALGKP